MKSKKEKLVENAKKASVKDAVIDTDARNKAGFLIIGIAILVLISCGIYWAVKGAEIVPREKKPGNEQAIQFQKEYESLNGKHDEREYLEVEIPSNNPIQYATFDEVLEILDKGTGVIYFGFPECPWCRSLVPNLLKAAENTGVDKIYYLNAKEERDLLKVDESGKIVTEKEGSENYQKLLKELDTYLSEYTLTNAKGKAVKTGEKRLYFPTVVVVKEGTVVGFHEGTVESQKDPKVPLTEKQQEELIKILEDMISTMSTCEGAC